MKVIDLLNKIANGEEVPEFIEIENKFTNENEMLFACTENIFHCLDNRELNLNSIISPIVVIEKKEEDKEIKELDYCEENTFSNMKEITYLTSEERRLLDSNFKSIKEKFDELIKAVNSIKKGN